jgi:hypothetical protein
MVPPENLDQRARPGKICASGPTFRCGRFTALMSDRTVPGLLVNTGASKDRSMAFMTVSHSKKQLYASVVSRVMQGNLMAF